MGAPPKKPLHCLPGSRRADFTKYHTFWVVPCCHLLSWGVLLLLLLCDPCDVTSCQHQDREGEEGACAAARDDQDGDQRGGNCWRDGERKEILPAADVWGQLDFWLAVRSDQLHCLCWQSTDVCIPSLWLHPASSVYNMLQYLLKVNEIKIKKGVDLLQNLIKYFHAQCK